MKDVFLSHASPDKQACVRPLAAELEKVGVTYWLDEAEIAWGEGIAAKINEGLRSSKYVLVFLSQHFIGRPWTETELFAALHQQVQSRQSRVLPIIVGDPAEVLKPYPLLAGLAYKPWSLGPQALAQAVVDRLQAERAVVSRATRQCLEAYFGHVTARRLEDAYACFSPSFQSSTGLEEYSKVFLKTREAKVRECELINHHDGEAFVLLTVEATGEDQRPEIWKGTVELMESGGRWLIQTMKGLKHYPEP